jgi:2',3'-cyclic-nucleotide 2'-phosphodiesterase (5'-nucleotidase family)
MQLQKQFLLGTLLSAALATSAFADSQITIIQTGDFHGHLAPRPNLRSTADYPGQMVGGLARVASEIKNIQAGKGGAGNTLILHTGDTIQGSGEALYTRGQAMVDVVDMLGIDGYAPGNWDYVYGPARFIEFFGDKNTLPAQAQGNPDNKNFGNRWGALASNLYYTSNGNAPIDPTAIGTDQDANLSQAEYDNYAKWYMDNGQRVLPPYSIKMVNGVKVGILGCTTSRGPQVVGKWVTVGLEFTDCSNEIPKFAKELRDAGAEVVVLISEIEIGRNIQLIKKLGAGQHIDLVLNADMHEESIDPIEVIDAAGNKTWINEAGQDGTLINEVTLSVQAGQVVGNPVHTAHRIDDRIVEDVQVANKVAEVSYPFNAGFTANTHVNPFSGTFLNGPLSDVVGSTQVALHRSNYSNETMPAVIEGSSHDFIADAMRWWAKSDMATVRGFRYGTHVAPGPITRNDLFHFVPIGPRVGKVSRISANQLRNQVDNSSLAVFSSNPGSPVTPRPNYNNTAYAPGGAKAGQSPGAGLPAYGLAGNSLGWGGGWLFAYSADGFHVDFEPYFTPSWQTLRSGSPFDLTNRVGGVVTGNTISGIYLDTTGGNNGQYANPPTDTSRARNLTVNMPCKYLPPAEITSRGCNVADTTTRYSTVITTSTGVYTTNWKANYNVAQLTANYPASAGYSNNATAAVCTTPAAGVQPNCGYTPFLLNPDGWQYLRGTPNQPDTTFTVNQHFKAPLFTAAGYWYAQSPNTVNNCNNCYPMGLNVTKGAANSAYVFPVNVDENGNAALDANGDPIYVRNNGGVLVMEDGKPVIAGAPIDLTQVIEKYLASLGGPVTAANLPANRISLVNPLPASSAGLRVMQPLCGTIGQTVGGNACP